MPPRLDAVKAYLESSKYKGALKWSTFNLEEASPYIIPHRKQNHLLYCQLTGATLNKVPEQIMKHVQGKNYLRKKKEHEEEVSKAIDVLEIPGEGELSESSSNPYESDPEDQEDFEQSESDGEDQEVLEECEGEDDSPRPKKKSRVADKPTPNLSGPKRLKNKKI